INESDFEGLESRESNSTSRAPTNGDTVGESRTFYLPVDKNNKPRKMGDGSYSIVFEAEDNDKYPHALKVLYDRQTHDADKISDGLMAVTFTGQIADYAVTLQRFKAECRSMRDIRGEIAKRNKLS